jgi:DNA-binding IscR family transcriptional regulator
MVEALEGPIALTECSEAICNCVLEEDCAVEAPWQTISLAVRGALESVTLADMARPSLAPPLVALGGVKA